MSEKDADLMRDGIHYTGNKGPVLGTRHVQVFLMAICGGITFAYRNMFSVALVAMTSKDNKSDAPTYDWDNTSIIISSVFWGAIILPQLSGYLGKKYGPKWFVFFGSLVDSLAFMLIPLAAKIGGSTGVMVLRFIQGLTIGIIFPMNMCVLGNWIPTEERSRMGFIGLAGITFFIITGSTATGYISDSTFGWPWIFYIFGVVGLVWTAVIGIFMHQKPETHPRITLEEKRYIQISLNRSQSGKASSTPWKQIFTSIHFWAIVVAQAGLGWITIILTSEIPLYISKVMNYGVKDNGLINAIPALCGTFAGVAISAVSDYIPKNNILSLLNTRRLFQTLGMCGVSAALVIMTFIPEKYKIWAVVVFCFAHVFLISTHVGGSTVNALDLSPTYSGIMFGCYDTVSSSISLVAPLLIQWLVTDQTDVSQWRTIFLISGAVAVLTSIFFDVFASATRQKWDAGNDEDPKMSAIRRKSSLFSVYSIGVN